MSKVIRLVPYQADWPDTYRRLAAGLAEALPPGACLHHIGSTAIPGMTAKDVIDLQATVDRLEDVAGDRLAGLGWIDRPGRVDHQPAGQRLDPAECTKRYFTLAAPAAHLHIRERGRFNQRYALLFRDFLRADPAAAAAYQAVKAALVDHTGGDPAAYYAVKDPVCDAIMAGAEAWARSTGWQVPPGD
ncbi:GrpB family protein [Novosphingobium flavum]|uniref:GrpB family protein n=1 Tax=Novosphingobium aerophilum TaxID=2839843 RepID=UPI00163ABB74|nr:GrpB family protein [Novosphingobium aerophilum]MBC2662149.1 GrpB family protein [Novosphingobium aerophilum]